MTNDAKQYDIVLSHDPDDCWALEWLLPRLEAAGFKMYVDQRDAAIGWPKSVNREQALKNSRHTLVVLTPRYLAGEWSMFEAFLAQSLNPSGRQRRLIPLLLEKCQLPAYFAHLEAADFTDPSRWEAEMARLVRNLSGNAEGVSHASAALSVDAVPAPATALPAGSRLPLRPNPFFTGRDADLRALAQAFTSSRTAVIATGIGGVGKTQLAAEFAHRYGPALRWWRVLDARFADPSALTPRSLRVEEPAHLNSTPTRQVYRWLSRSPKVRRAWDEDVP
ncbi:TIR domain-containing protein [Kouleothrix sp.]|uniref:toll/interleukin-1 receptor domain-containing protein n=1 Tax=Kouleothrix sp. TaxID=2779161 RepID=UPI00391BE5D6